MCQLMAIEMGLLEAIVMRKGQSVDAHTLANEINRDELLIGQTTVVQLDQVTADDLQYAS